MVYVKSPTIVIPSEARNLFLSDEVASLLAMTSLEPFVIQVNIYLIHP